MLPTWGWILMSWTLETVISGCPGLDKMWQRDGLPPGHMSVRDSVSSWLQTSGPFGLFSWILSAPLSHKTFVLTGSSTSTLPPSPLRIQPTFFFPMSISLLNKWHLFSWPVTVRRGISHWRTALIYTPLWLSPQKIKLSKIFPIHPPPGHTHWNTNTHTVFIPCPPSMSCIIKLADVEHTRFTLWS